MDALSDEALLAGLGSGDGDAAAAFVRRFQRRVYGLAVTMLRDPAVAELPDDQRRALVLAVYAGRTAREISELDGTPLGTVKTRIRTAMLKLRDTLGVGNEL